MFNFFGSKKSSTPLSPGTDPSKQAKKFSFEKYVDPTGEFSSNKLKYSLWYVENKVLLYKILVASLVVFVIVTWGISVWWWGTYFVYGLKANQNLDKALVKFDNFTALNTSYNPKPLSVVDTYTLAGGVEKYNVVTEVVNSNDRFLASFEYYFVVDGVKTPAHTATILPGEDKFFGYFDLKLASAPGSAVFAIGKITWYRIPNQTITNVKQWQEDHLHFSVNDFEFTRAESAEGVGAHIIRFKLTNYSPYNYVAGQFYVGLYAQQTLVGMFPITVQKFRSLETRNIDLRSYVSNLEASEVRIFPLINIYDPEVYMTPGQ
jgi:hypothetical protein